MRHLYLFLCLLLLLSLSACATFDTNLRGKDGYPVQKNEELLLKSAAGLVDVSNELLDIDWEVQNRYRVINPEHETLFYNEFVKYIIDAGSLHTESDSNQKIGRDPYQSLIPKKRYKEHKDEDYSANYKTHWNSSEARYDSDWVNNPNRSINAVLSHKLESGARCSWRLNGQTKNQSCDEIVTFSLERNKEYVLSVEIISGSGSRRLNSKIIVEDILILGLGESFASGEGNPHRQQTGAWFINKKPPLWWDARCHRSLINGQSLAAAQLAVWKKRSSVTFLSYACSGAQIDWGTLQPWPGVENERQVTKKYEDHNNKVPQDQKPYSCNLGKKYLNERGSNYPRTLLDSQDGCPLPAQVDRASDDIGTLRKPKYIFLSDGGNDIGFGKLGQGLLRVRGAKKQINDMLTSFKLPPCDEEKDKIECAEYAAKKMADTVLPDAYDELFTQLDQRFKGTKVILTDYPDQTKRFKLIKRADNTRTVCTRDEREAGEKKCFEYCKDAFLDGRPDMARFPFLARGMNKKSAKVAEEIIQNLNREGAEAVERTKSNPKLSNTSFVHADGMFWLAEGKGYCNSNRWFLTALEANSKAGFVPRGETYYTREALLAGKTATHENNWKVNSGGIPTGLLHPNVFGHCRYADVILKNLNEEDKIIRRHKDSEQANKSVVTCQHLAWPTNPTSNDP